NLLGSWWGRWNIQNVSSYAGGQLFIYKVDSKGFSFHLSVFRGAHTGDVSGVSQFSKPNEATFLVTWDGNECTLNFLKGFRGNMQVAIEEVNCSYFHGAGAGFSGTYIKEHEVFFEFSILDERDMERLYQIQGEYYWKFRDIFYQIS